MPNFLGRPNTPNALAQTLVQLAAQQTDPLAEGLKKVGQIADTVTAQQMRLQAMEKENDMRERSAEKAHERAKELKTMDRDSAIFERLLSSDRIISGMMGEKMTSADARQLLPPEGNAMAEADFGPAPKPKKVAGQAQQKGTRLSEVGVKIEGDPSFTPAKEKVEIDAALAKQYKLPASAIGKTLTMDELIRLRNQDQRGGRGGGAGRDPDRLKLAEQIVNRNPDMTDAPLDKRMAAIYAAYDALETIKSGGMIKEPAPKIEAPKKKGMSIFGFNFGGEETPAATPAPVKAPGQAKPKESREEMIARLKKKGYK